jgi:hypothetical protein
MQNLTNPWTEIPLDDYELHMSHSSVGQSALLNALTKKYLDNTRPSAAIFLGIAGGNGLEHIDENITKTVVGIDINQTYLDATNKRYSDKIAALKLLQLDITKNTGTIINADFVWAALVLEYTGIDNALQFAKNNLLAGGHFVVTIQQNNNRQTVSATGIESIKKAGDVFKVVDRQELLAKASGIGFALKQTEENILPNGKSFITFHFIK